MFICEWNKIINGRNFDRTERAKSPVLERGADGKLRPKKKKININDLDADTLRKLGIDPNLSKKEIAKKLKVLKNYIEPFVSDVMMDKPYKPIQEREIFLTFYL